jgi:predicted HD superfamily hydrolase involved in NAD metabolism
MPETGIYNGIPENITLEFARDWVRPRNSEKRFKHICGVAEVAAKIARAAGADVFLAELGGWLHDACKEVKDSELVELAERYRLQVGEIEKLQGHLLHGPVAAETVKRELNIDNEELLDAIRQHTLGAVNMTKLSKVVFLADCLEESRPADYTQPIWDALDIDGECNLDRAIYKASDLNLLHVIEKGRLIHPLSILVRNHHLQKNFLLPKGSRK